MRAVRVTFKGAMKRRSVYMTEPARVRHAVDIAGKSAILWPSEAKVLELLMQLHGED